MNSFNIPSEIPQIELIYKPNPNDKKARKVHSSEDVYEAFKSVWDVNKIDFIESFKIMLLNRVNTILGVVDISTGGNVGTTVDSKLVFAAALKANAHSIILAHNHPSGNLQPSIQDQNLTRRLIEIGRLLDLPILDHIIVTSEGYYSFLDDGNL